MDDSDRWHPSGGTAVYDAAMNLVGHTTIRVAVEDLWLSRPRDDGAFQFVGKAKRVLFESQDGSPRYWIYRVTEGDPADVPGFIRLPF
jgi:hypothetical protein